MGRAKVICYSVAVTVGGDVGMRRRIWLLTSAPDDDDSDNDGNEKSIRGGVRLSPSHDRDGGATVTKVVRTVGEGCDHGAVNGS